ncbi:hypothetical protein B0H15DRAFT_1022305 [Mycena belliarum]|uniref:GATA-type domain-containing protein n=1 Tax=Mycena belliarum TaxID=1033014 RepID=A0AAD6U5R0_9AGAR|nr:hypothetical protein B0H15DRAFT_1022305 [Mycena belliae]
MSDPRRYNYGLGGSSSQFPLTRYSSLENAVSYPTTNQPISARPSHPQSYSSSRGSPSPYPTSQAHPPGYGSQYGMTGPPTSQVSPHGYDAGTQYPNTPYNAGYQAYNAQRPSAQAPPAGWNGAHMPPTSFPYEGASNYPYAAPAPTVYPTSHYANAAPEAGGADGAFAGIKQCSHCHATTTPLWRRDPVTQDTLCNACGLYKQQRHAARPRELIEADHDDSGDEEDGGGGGDGPECSHCHTRQTSVWRRNKEGDHVCNACGVYQRLRGKERPLSLKRNKIKPRAKHPQT